MMRRLSSILFADIAGYTALMQEDEDKARVVLQKFRDSLHENVPRYSGEIIQFYGDGVLVLFKSSVEAMNCAIKLQQEFLDTPKVPVRMGLHSGDVVFEDDNVFGNSVNEASRIESLGIPNSILFSERIKNDIKNHSEFSFVSLGEFEFKSLDRPMEVFALTGQKLAVPEKGNIDGKLKKTSKGSAISVYTWLVPILILAGLIAWWNGAFSSTGSEVTESKFTKVAVLPFEINGSSELDYLGEGLMDLLSNKINLIEGMVSVDPKISNAIFERSGRQYAEAIGMPDWDTQQTKYLVTGSLVQLGDSYTLLGSVKNNKGKEIASVEEAIVTKDSLFPHVNSFFKKIVSEIFQNKEIDFNSYALQSTENYDALNDFLKAEQARRQGKWELAHNFYKAATKKDSTFALAWLRWSNNIGFYDPDRGGPASERHIKRMLDKYKGKLPPIFQNYVEAWNLSTSGKIKEAIEKSKENLETFGDHVDGLYLYGDLLFHCNFLFNRSSRESIPVFERLLEYDENYLEAEVHLLYIALMDKDSVYLKKMMQKFPKGDPWGGIVDLGRILTDYGITEFLRDSLPGYMQKYNAVYDFFPLDAADAYIEAYKKQVDSMDMSLQTANNNRLTTLELQGMINKNFLERPDYYLKYNYNYSFNLEEKTFQPFSKLMIDSIITSLTKSNNFDETHAWRVAARGIYYLQGGYDQEAEETISNLKKMSDTADSPIGKSQFNYLRHRLKLVQARLNSDSQAVEAELDSLYKNLIYYESYGAFAQFYKGIKVIEAEHLLEQGEYEKSKQIYELLPEINSRPLMHAHLKFKIAYLEEQLGNMREAYYGYKYFIAVYGDCDDFYQQNVAHAKLFVAQYEMAQERN